MRVVPEENTYYDIFVKVPETRYFNKLFSNIASIAEIFNVVEKLYFENQELKDKIEELETNKKSWFSHKKNKKV